jgi:hypothetical protein
LLVSGFMTGFKAEEEEPEAFVKAGESERRNKRSGKEENGQSLSD